MTTPDSAAGWLGLAAAVAILAGCAEQAQHQTVNTAPPLPITTVTLPAARAWLATQPTWPDPAQTLGVVLATSVHDGNWYALVLPQVGQQEVVVNEGCTDTTATDLLIRPGAAIAYRHRGDGTVVFGTRAWTDTGCKYQDALVAPDAVPSTKGTGR